MENLECDAICLKNKVLPYLFLVCISICFSEEMWAYVTLKYELLGVFLDMWFSRRNKKYIHNLMPYYKDKGLPIMF